MHIRGSKTLGLKIISLQNGVNIDTVKDLIYDPVDHTVKAFVIDSGGWFSDTKILLITDVKSIGDDAIMIDSETVIRKASEVSGRIASIAKNDIYLSKTNILTEDGKELGSVSDIIFDATSGKVVELEVSQGLTNLSSGKKHVKVDDIVTVGEDATIVRAYTVKEFEKQAQEQGIQGAINKGKDYVSTQGPAFIESTTSKAEAIATKARQKTQEFKEKAVQTAEDPQTKATMKHTELQAKEAVSHATNTI